MKTVNHSECPESVLVLPDDDEEESENRTLPDLDFLDFLLFLVDLPIPKLKTVPSLRLLTSLSKIEMLAEKRLECMRISMTKDFNRKGNSKGKQHQDVSWTLLLKLT